MGSFFGHITAAVFYLVIGFWWMCNACVRYIQCRHQGEVFLSPTGYAFPGRRQLRVEFVIKVVFPTVGIVVEVIDNGGSFFDADDNLRGLAHLLHMSVYGMYTLAAAIDLISYQGAPLPTGLDRVSYALSFFWNAIAFRYHVDLPSTDGMEKLMHELPTYAMVTIGLAFLVELVRPTWFLAHLIRIVGTTLLGSWFFQLSFIMYSATPFPGSLPNPSWDRYDARNVRFLVALFGFHMCCNLVVVAMIYIITSYILKGVSQREVMYSSIPMDVIQK